MTKMALAVLSICAMGAAVAVFSKLADPRIEGVPADAPTYVSSGADDGESFVRDWERALRLAVRDDDSALWEVVRRWMAWDGRTVMEAVAALEGRWQRKAWALSLWLEAAPTDAFAWAGALGADGEWLQVAAVEALAARDPAGAVAVAGRLDGSVRVDAAKAALGVWANTDPMAAWRAAQEVSVAFTPWWSPPGLFELHDRTVRRRTLSLAVLEVWAESGSLREPLNAVASTPDANVPPRWVKGVLARWVAVAPQDALAWASALPPRIDGPAPLLRVEALGATLAAMSVHWPDMAKQALDELGDWRSDDRQDIYNTVGYQELIRRFAETTEPRRVASWFENHPDEWLRSLHSDDVARAYARAHPEEAVAWARALPRGRQRTEAVWAALNVVADEAPDRIAAMLLDFGDADLLESCQPLLLGNWAKVDPVAALRWVDRHAPEEWSTERRLTTFWGWATYDPVAAATHVDSIADPAERAWAARHVIDGTFSGITRRPAGKKGIVEHIPMIERLYGDLPRERRSKHVAYFLYRHFEHSDPQRAAQYKAEAGDDHGNPWSFYPPD